MTRVPTDGGAETAMDCGLCKKFVVMVSAPTPFSYCPSCGQWNEWDEIDGKAVIMRALPRSRFSGPLGEEVELPYWASKTLERLEEGLRLAGLIGPRERLTQSIKRHNAFRVEKLKPREPSVYVHPSIPSEKEDTRLTPPGLET